MWVICELIIFLIIRSFEGIFVPLQPETIE